MGKWNWNSSQLFYIFESLKIKSWLDIVVHQMETLKRIGRKWTKPVHFFLKIRIRYNTNVATKEIWICFTFVRLFLVFHFNAQQHQVRLLFLAIYLNNDFLTNAWAATEVAFIVFEWNYISCLITFKIMMWSKPK